MNPCSNLIKISGPEEDIHHLLNDNRNYLAELISPNLEEELNDFLSIEEEEDGPTINIYNLDTKKPPIDTIKFLGNSYLNCNFYLEYLNVDDWFAGLIEIKNGGIVQEECYQYKYSQDLQEFANRTGHLIADVMAFSMKDMFCYIENEEKYKQQGNIMTTHFDQINEWAKERNLLDIEWDKAAHASFLAEELSEFLRSKDGSGEIDALCDMIVFAANAMRIRGYDPNIAMDETLKEISSRTGAFNPETGKWEKFKTPEAMALWYSADYDKAKL